MKFSITTVFITILAIGSTSVIAHGTHERTHESATALLARYIEDSGLTAREVIDHYELFSRTTPKKSSGSGLLRSAVKGLLRNSGAVSELAGAVQTLRNSGSRGGGGETYEDN